LKESRTIRAQLCKLGGRWRIVDLGGSHGKDLSGGERLEQSNKKTVAKMAREWDVSGKNEESQVKREVKGREQDR